MKQFFLLIAAILFYQSLSAQGILSAKLTGNNYVITAEGIKQLSTGNVISPRLVTTNYLVSHHEILQKIQEGFFIKKASVTVPDDNLCITVTEAKAWLTLDETKLPTNGRMPLWQELVPTAQCTGVNKKVVNGACETGVQTWTRNEYNSTTHMWKCYYVWKWSDGTQSAEYYIESAPGCVL